MTGKQCGIESEPLRMGLYDSSRRVVGKSVPDFFAALAHRAEHRGPDRISRRPPLLSCEPNSFSQAINLVSLFHEFLLHDVVDCRELDPFLECHLDRSMSARWGQAPESHPPLISTPVHLGRRLEFFGGHLGTVARELKRRHADNPLVPVVKRRRPILPKWAASTLRGMLALRQEPCRAPLCGRAGAAT